MTDLRRRNRERARERIVAAAFALFAERGFADVTVADIAERAEVGRTTFFRHFGDKQEVAFSNEHAMSALWGGWLDELPPLTTLAEALAEMRRIAVAMCRTYTADAAHYLAHQRLLRDNPELLDRSNRKFDRMAQAARHSLERRGAEPEVAALAAHTAFACYRAGLDLAGGDPAALPAAVDAAFARLAER
ncbi:TetR/AcrR family transcriptional regulator [Saccharothrix violaceirubra]|uniref:AcrR family transcriptional regulator n=1 Tax=Saccharothrix violaceirubra TaxID=413306 RepID=A0A7W7T2B8_9PSEU|nr:helix-turn-helix domain-containing protein [Saccharothrix violaceirubra]MBB4965274.1 AcrR family transcriptional regulator [Saccharothrix violaceirubra]